MTTKRGLISIVTLILTATAFVESGAQHYSVAPIGPGGPSPTGLIADHIYAPGPVVAIPGATPVPINVDAFSFGVFDYPLGAEMGFDFSVSTLSGPSVGVAGSAVAFEAVGGGLGAGDHVADVFTTSYAALGANTLTWDGDGIPNPILAPALGLAEPFTEDVDGWDSGTFQDVIFFSVDVFSAASIYGPAFSSADVLLYGSGGPGPYDALGAFAPYASAAALGLDTMGLNSDEIDALIVFDDGDLVYGGLGDAILFSLAPGSAAFSTTYLGAGPEDILIATPGAPGGVYLPGVALGLTAGVADINALSVAVPEPVTGLMALVGVLMITAMRRRR